MTVGIGKVWGRRPGRATIAMRGTCERKKKKPAISGGRKIFGNVENKDRELISEKLIFIMINLEKHGRNAA